MTYEPGKRYDVIMADPPWAYENWTDAKNGAASSAMEVMGTEDIAALNVGEHYATKDAWLFCWATWPKLEDLFSVLRGWDFGYVTAIPWIKTVPNSADIANGIGFHSRGCSEALTICRRGKARKKKSWSRKDNPIGLLTGPKEAPVFYAPKGRRHSGKPLELQVWIERGYGGPGLELFARNEMPGWDCLGYDTGWKRTPEGAMKNKSEEPYKH